MTSEHDTARLSDYLDGELSAPERAELEAHVAECTTCARTLTELGAVVEAADRLPAIPPEADLWPGIEARLSPRGEASADVVPLSRHRVAMTIPQLAAAAVALVLFAASAVWLAIGGEAGSSPGSVVLPEAGTPTTAVAFADFDQAIDALEEEYRTRRESLDPETIRVVERNLAIIDQAIGEAREALAADPSSGFLSSHLADAMRQKLDLLRQAAMIAQSET